MKQIPPISAIVLSVCLVVSASAQTRSRQRLTREVPQAAKPAVVVISDRPLLNYTTRRNGDLFTITIYDVGNFKTVSGGQPFEQQQPAGTNDLVITFQLLPRTNPQIEQAGTQLSIFFESASLPLTGIPAGTFTPPARTPAGQTTTGTVVATSPTVVTAVQTEPIVVMAALDVKSFITPTPSPTPACNIIEPEKDKDDPKQELLVIDANTGKILEGSTRVGDNTRVKVVFVNKNPFKYDYSFQLVPKDIGNTTVLSFLNLIPGLPAIPGVLEGTIESATKTDTTAQAGKAVMNTGAVRAGQARIAAAQPSKCDLFAEDLKTVVQNSETIAKALTESKTILEDAAKAYQNFLKETNETFTKGGGRDARIKFAKEELCDEGVKALPTLQKVLDFKVDEFSKKLKLDVFAAHVTVLDDDLTSAQCDQTTQALYKRVIDKLEEDVANYKTKLEEIKKGFADSQKKLEGPVKNIKTVIGSSTSFAEAAYAPSLGEATSVAITITRKNIRDEVQKDEVIAVSPPLQIGEPRVILSAGMGFSSINERKVVRQQSLVPDDSGGMTLGNRFGFENRSQFRPSGVVMLNGILKRFRLFGPGDTTFALSGGLVFSDRSDGLATEFIGGPSLGFANNRVFFTFGFHAARVEELSGGFKIGDPVPANLTDPLPVQKNWLNGLIMSLTFRIQP